MSGGQGPPAHARRRRSRRRDDGTIEVGDSQAIDWSNLTPLEKHLLGRIEELEDRM